MSGKSLMHGPGESYHGRVPTKQPNQGGEPSAEVAEGRPWTKENTPQSNPRRTLSRQSGPSGLERVRERARKNGKLKFTALLHQVTVGLLRESYFGLKRQAAPGRRGIRDDPVGRRFRDPVLQRGGSRCGTGRGAGRDDRGRLRLHPTKTRIVNAHHEGLDLLGYHLTEGTRWPRAKSLKKFKDTIRDKTRRTQGQSLSAIIDEVNRTVRGWLEYDQHSRRFTFDLLDSWVRMRLGSILRRRQGRRGRGRGADPQRWPKAFFAKLGLFSRVAAPAAVCQSSSR